MSQIKPFRRYTKQARGRLTAWIRWCWRKTIFSTAEIPAASRTRARGFRRSMARLGLQHSDISRAIPALARSFAVAELHRKKRQGWAFLFLLILTLPLWISGFGHSLLFPANLFLPELDDDAITLARFLFLIGYFCVLFVAAELQMRGLEWKQLVEFSRPAMRSATRFTTRSRWIGVAGLAFFLVMFGLALHDSHPGSIWPAMTAAGVASLWFTTFGFIWFKISSGTGIGSHSPDVALVCILADAYTAVIAGGAVDFRSFARRNEISMLLRAAATLLEGPMVRMLARDDASADAVVRPPLAAAAAGLRQKLAWLATPGVATREELARMLGEALIAAATCDLARLAGSEPPAPSASSIRWVSRLFAIAQGGVLALGAPTVIWLLWPYFSDAAVRSVAVQFAALCFVVGTFSILDPTGRDKLNTVVSVGATLFGWGKPKA
ncbi:hypothetical protein SAMN05192541_1033 [Bradyrhizobium arachidis]|nr:hypothetical protein SAMN05192541_1033 [Bradyrhizobium arachidis]